MRAVIQRVRSCSVTVGGEITGSIKQGLLVYLGVEQGDTEDDLRYMADKTLNLRIFPDNSGKMNHSVVDLKLDILVVSQFTLCADARKGRRPSYSHAADSEIASRLYEGYLKLLGQSGISPQCGVFGALMDVSYTNTGPVTILLDSKKTF
jgi:D-aminoacyl-tRNA deacylase